MAHERLKAEIREVISETPEARYYHRLSCIELLAQGHSYARVAKPFGHSPSTLKRWWRKYREGGSEALREAPRGRRKPVAQSSAKRSPTGRR
jgi:transposase